MYGIAMKMPPISDSLSGVMNGETTLVAMIEVPSGNFSISGCATSVNSWFEKKASGMKQIVTATTARSRRVRSSRRCEISVPSARDSGSRGL